MARNQDFQPNWVSAPGDTISDILEEKDFSVTEFAQSIGRTLEYTNDLLQGRLTITIEDARKLEKVLGASVEFWMLRDFQYREDVAGLQAFDEEWLAELPIGDMIKFGWLRPVPHPAEELAACLRFFNVSNVQAWREKYANIEEMIALKTSPSFDSRSAAVATWLRQGEIEADAIQCKPWDANKFEKSLASIRSLSRQKDPTKFIPKLQKRCADSGVAVAIVRAPNGCRAGGATEFLSQDKALVLLSFRYLTDDHFWFTFFHEAGHLLLHGKKQLFLEMSDVQSVAEEVEANDFAARTLVPPEYLDEMLNLPTDHRRVMKFAKKIGVSPGIIAGQLQHHGRISYNQLNRLKRRYTWS